MINTKNNFKDLSREQLIQKCLKLQKEVQSWKQTAKDWKSYAHFADDSNKQTCQNMNNLFSNLNQIGL